MSKSQLRDEEISKSEKIFQLAQDAYTNAEKRFDDAERKIGGYLSILFILLGLATISIDKLRSILAIATTPNILFGFLTAAFYLCGLVAFFYFVQAIRVQQIEKATLGKSVASYFERYTLSVGLGGLAKAFFCATEQFRHRTQEKLRLAHKGFIFLTFAVVLAVLAGCSYFFINIPEDPKMTLPTNSGDKGNSNQPQPKPSPEPSSDSTQAAQDASELFEDLQKSFEGSKTSKKK